MHVQSASSGETDSARQDQASTLWAIQPGDVTLPGLDPVFLIGDSHALRLPAWYPAARMEAHLAHSLLRNPHDLTSHVRRILYWRTQPGCPGLAAALTDLAIVLDGRGTALWQRLRRGALTELPADTYPVDDRACVHLDAKYGLFSVQPPIPHASPH